MNWLHLAGAALMAVVLASSAQAQKDKKKDDPKKGAVEAIDAEKLKPGQVIGKVMQFSETSIRVRVDYVHYELNQAKGRNSVLAADRQAQHLIREQQAIARAQQRLVNARNPAEQWRALQDLQNRSSQMQSEAVRAQLQALTGKNGGQNLFKEVHEYKDVDIELDDKVVYRTSFLPYVFDDMGNPKKYTDQEKKELKGNDPKLPGYKAAASDVKVGAKVTVTLSKNKETENKIRGTLVLITEESREPTKEEPKKKKKNK